ncbi:MAG: hypothetical protein MN733_12870 [Nitrososphaera sp.]|nr:hypothetical protein [Nitrososphaera sp.]
MIGTLNSWVSKVVGTVSGPLYTWGSSPKVKKAKKVVLKGKKAKCSHKGKCKC